MSGELSASELGERLRDARVGARVTQDTAAEAIGVGRTTLVAMEAGTRRARSAEVLKLASLYKTSANALLQRGRVALDFSLQFRRAESTRSDDDAVATTQKLQRLAEGYLSLEHLLNNPLNPDYPAPRVVKRARPRDQAEDAALELRGRYGLGMGPLSDPIAFIEDEMKVRVFERVLPSSVAGAFAYDKHAGAVIVVNALHPKVRRAWTAAHEVGHFVAHRDEIDVVHDREDERARDRFADAFAAAFLMPAPGLRRRFDDQVAELGRFSPRSLVSLARAHGVSVQAMGRRLEALGLLPAGTYDDLKRRGMNQELIERLMGASAADEPRVPASRRMALLAVDAVAQQIITESQAVDMLQLDRVAVRDLIAAFSLQAET